MVLLRDALVGVLLALPPFIAFLKWGNGNGEVPPGQNVDEDGNIVNNGGNTPPGLNRREKADKPENPNKPEKPENPGTEDSSDKKANKAQQGTHIYTYDGLNRMVTSDISKVESSYTYDTLGNLIYEKEKNVKTDYQYNELNQLVSRKQGNESYTYSYDKRGNRIAETGKKETREYIYDETNHLVEGTNWKGDKSAYTYNGLDVRINNTQTAHSGSVYSRDYVIDYTSLERDDLMVFAEGDGQLDYVQREVYAGSERIEQFTDRSSGGYERLLYVHEDLMGNTRYYTKANGQSYAELTYDAWGMPESPNKLLNNDHGNYVYATYTGHIFDTTLDIYFAEARFYDANTRTWLAMDPIKSGGNWYQYCYSSPVVYYDPDGESAIAIIVGIAINAIVDGAISAGTEVVDQLIENGGNFDEIDGKEVLKQAGIGAGSSVVISVTTLGAGSLLTKVGKLGTTAAKIANNATVRKGLTEGIEFIGNTLTTLFSGDEDNFIDALIDTGLSNIIGRKISKILPDFGDQLAKKVNKEFDGDDLLELLSKNSSKLGQLRSYGVYGMWEMISGIPRGVFEYGRDYVVDLTQDLPHFISQRMRYIGS